MGSAHDRGRLSWRTCHQRKSLLPLGVLLLLVRRVPLYRLQVACWLEGCHCQGDESRCCQHAEPGLSGDRRLLVHLPCCLPLPVLEPQWCTGCRRHPARLLCVGCDLEVWCRLPHLQHYHSEVGGSDKKCPPCMMASFAFELTFLQEPLTHRGFSSGDSRPSNSKRSMFMYVA